MNAVHKPRFGSTVPFYARYRLSYPYSLIKQVAERVPLAKGEPVLDLGCGPGLLAIPFSQLGARVTAVDPEPEMLIAARQAAEEADVAIDFRHGSSFALPEGIGPFKLVTIGRAFHWMDRTETLQSLDRLISPGGAVGLFGDSRIKTAENAWRDVVTDHVGRYTEDLPLRRRDRPGYRSHEAYLLASNFSRLERCGVVFRCERSLDDVIGLVYSMSIGSPEKLGDKAMAFERDLRAELLRLSPDGVFVEIAELEALIAHRASERP